MLSCQSVGEQSPSQEILSVPESSPSLLGPKAEVAGRVVIWALAVRPILFLDSNDMEQMKGSQILWQGGAGKHDTASRSLSLGGAGCRERERRILRVGKESQKSQSAGKGLHKEKAHSGKNLV